MVLGAHLHGSRKRGKECKYLVLIGHESQFSIFSMSFVFPQHLLYLLYSLILNFTQYDHGKNVHLRQLFSPIILPLLTC